MVIAAAQRDMRSAFLGGFMGQTVSAGLWSASAALGVWGSPRPAIVLLVAGGFLIFPLTQVGLKVIGRPGRHAHVRRAGRRPVDRRDRPRAVDRRPFTTGAWFTAAVLLLFGWLGRSAVLDEETLSPLAGTA